MSPTGNISGSAGWANSAIVNTNILQLTKSNGERILSVKPDGSVEWQNGVDVDAAAEALSLSLSVGVERAVGITTLDKQLRDAVFEEIISIANSKGSLTVDDLTFLHQSAKIMDKLSGII